MTNDDRYVLDDLEEIEKALRIAIGDLRTADLSEYQVRATIASAISTVLFHAMHADHRFEAVPS